MCGIAGFSGVLEHPIAQTIGDVIAHRGPDHQGSIDDNQNRVHLFHQRLSILDLSSAAHQPMICAQNRYVIVYNGEIYNFLELREKLRKKGHVFRTTSDTEVILHSFLEWGEDCLASFNGIFALAIWDTKTKSLLIARDPYGVKPLYIAEDKRGIGFCSEIKGLLKLFPHLREIDADAIRHYFTFIYCPGERTPIKGLRKVNPGCTITIRSGKIVKERCFYKAPFLEALPVERPMPEVLDILDDAVSKAVNRQMIADVQVGAFLSGGVDSSTIVAYAKKFNPNINCFTIRTAGGRDAGETDDLDYAIKVADHLDVNLNIIDFDASQLSQDLSKMIWHLDEPIADPASLNTFYIAQAARAQGMTVLLSGTGGDDLFSGYRRHQALYLKEKLALFADVAKKIIFEFSRAGADMGKRG